MHHDELRFYWTVASGSSRKALRLADRDETVTDHGRTIDLEPVPEPESAMVSYATKNNKPWPGPEWFIDSGGYSTLDASGEYDASPTEYVRWIGEHEQREGVTIDRYALRDWACEKDLLRANGRSERLHQNWTIRDHVACLEAADEYGVDADPVAVIQGYDVRDYLRHVDYYRDHGLLTDHLGIGSVCKRTDIEEIRSLVLRLREAIPSRVSLHGFGVTRELLEYPDVVDALESVDTAAWDSRAYFDAVENASSDGHRYTWDRVLEAYQDYRREVRAMLNVLATDDSRRVRVFALEDFDTAAVDVREVHPIAECRCGTLIDPEAPATHGPGCRHCDRARMNYTLALDGLRCDPEFDEHHALCPCHDDPAADCLAGAVPADTTRDDSAEAAVATDGGEQA